jgi:DNA invertase Pin-like site-specific DNA recombinase
MWTETTCEQYRRDGLRYASDMTDAEWAMVEPFMPAVKRLGRPRKVDVRSTLAAITAKKAGFKSIGDTWADTTTSHGRLMLTVLGGLAEFERDLIRARTGEGRARAVARGQKMGRPFKLTDHQKREAIKRRNQGETLADIARSYNVSPATISRLTA